MSDDRFVVEGRFFPNSLYAFTFAQIQADRMDRAVEVHNNYGSLWVSTWHATAHPEGYRRAHLQRGV